MRLYFAGIERGVFARSKYAGQIYDALVKAGIKYALTSYFYVKKDTSYITKKNRIKHLFLDSGAFSAHHSKAVIEIKDYIEFVKKYEKNLDVYANLDVIGNAQATYDNQKIMEKAGLNPLPTFHYGEDLKWLSDYANSYDYIALGGLVGKRHKQRLPFLFKCFNMVPSKVKVHGFGMTSPRLLKMFPWYSADSINWLMGEMRGTLYQYDRGNIKQAGIDKKVEPFTGQHMSADKWNIIQWKKYAEYLDMTGRWAENRI